MYTIRLVMIVLILQSSLIRYYFELKILNSFLSIWKWVVSLMYYISLLSHSRDTNTQRKTNYLLFIISRFRTFKCINMMYKFDKNMNHIIWKQCTMCIAHPNVHIAMMYTRLNIVTLNPLFITYLTLLKWIINIQFDIKLPFFSQIVIFIKHS